MGIPQTGHPFIPLGKIRQNRYNVNQPLKDDPQRVSDDDNIGIVSDIATGGSKMDDAPCFWTLLSKGVDVSHNVVLKDTLKLLGPFQIQILNVGLQLLYLLFSYGKTKLPLHLSQSHPELPPGGKLLLWREELHHSFGRVSFHQRMLKSHHQQPTPYLSSIRATIASNTSKTPLPSQATVS